MRGDFEVDLHTLKYRTHMRPLPYLRGEKKTLLISPPNIPWILTQNSSFLTSAGSGGGNGFERPSVTNTVITITPVRVEIIQNIREGEATRGRERERVGGVIEIHNTIY